MLKIENLKKTYDKGSRHRNEVLHGLSLTLPDTGFICILGASGCGKTSLLNAIGGLDSFDSGKIITETATIHRSPSAAMERERNASFGYIFQNYYLLSEHSVAYNVYLGLHSLALSHKDKMKRVRDALARVDMLRYRKRLVGELSGGQQQRVAIARAIARRPRVIFADEPTGNLDQANTMNICSILKELSRESLVVMVTHEEHIARFFADRIITLRDGQIVSDATDWARSAIDAGAKDTLYAGDYTESKLQNEQFSLRLLHAEGAAPVEVVMIAEADRVVIKVNDPRIVLCSELNAVPYLAEGQRPVLEFPTQPSAAHQERAADASRETASSKGLGLGMLWREARALVTGKRLRRFGTAAFIMLLSFMLSISVADIVTVAHIDPEDFITTDSHVLGFSFERGPLLVDKYESISPYMAMFRDFLEGTGEDFDYIPVASVSPEYKDDTVPQFGSLRLSFHTCGWAPIARLDAETIISGRMPQRSDEIVLDRWMAERLLSEDGVLQNLIPNADYLLGKTLTCERKTYQMTVVGICDSGEPSMYLSREAMLAMGVYGSEVITRSEYIRLTGDDAVPELGAHECIALKDNIAGMNEWTSISSYVGSQYEIKLAGTLADTDDSIGAKLIIADEALDPLYRTMIEAQSRFSIWCADKDAIYRHLDNDYPETLVNAISLTVNDRYAMDMAAYTERTALKVDARTIVTATVLITATLMLYLMQRSKIRQRMDLIAVYRLLGIPKRNLLTIFAIESLLLTLKYALPTVLAVFIGFRIMASVEMLAASALLFPLWAAGLTLGAIALFRLLVATLPVLRLLHLPPARLAAKYDF